MSISLEEVQALADELSPRDLARLLEHLSSRLAHALAGEKVDNLAAATPSLEQLWQLLDADPDSWNGQVTTSEVLSASRR